MRYNTQGLEPVIAINCRILILGSFPSLLSLQKGEYYANPRNMFWAIMAEVLGIPEQSSYIARINGLLSQSIGLWDVYASCDRPTSADGAIKNPVPNDIRFLLHEYSSITWIFCNGREAENGFSRFFPDIHIPARYLPSSSSAHVIPRAEKIKKWLDIKK